MKGDNPARRGRSVGKFLIVPNEGVFHLSRHASPGAAERWGHVPPRSSYAFPAGT
jgi:hypothetical protein